MKALLLVAIVGSVVAGTLRHLDHPAAASRAQPASPPALLPLVASPDWSAQPDTAATTRR